MHPFILFAAAVSVAATTPVTVAKLQWQRRVLIVAAPSQADASLAEQRRILRDWKAGSDDRDITVVEIVGDSVQGAADRAAALRKRYRLPPAGFTAILIGKDGGEKLRADRPFPASALAATIDAMPMRRAGQR